MPAMLKNYLKIAFRSISRNKFHSLINILGLALGFASVMVIALFVKNELQYDRFNVNADRIYKLIWDERVSRPDGRVMVTTSPPMGPFLEANYPEVKKAVRFRYTDESLMRYRDQQFYEDGVVYADTGFFEVFSFDLESGDPATALTQPNSILITREMAVKYFGEQDPMGKIIVLDDVENLRVTGVLKPFADNSSLQFDFVISFSTFKVPFGYPTDLSNWGWISFHTYLLLSTENAEASLPTQIVRFSSYQY